VFRSRFTLCLSTLVVMALLSACGGGGGSNAPTPVPPAPSLTALAVTPVNPKILRNGTKQFIATGSYSDGTAQDLTASVTWSSATSANVTITAGGLATGIATGTSVILASKGTIKGDTTLTVNDTPTPTLVALHVAPTSASLAKSATRQFTATGSYTDGTSSDMTNAVVWTSGTPEVASVSGSGLVTGLAGASVTVAAQEV